MKLEIEEIRGGSRTVATSKMKLFVTIVAVNYCHKELHLRCCSSPRSATWDRDKNGGGLIEFVRKGFITKRLKDYETQICETICSEFTMSKRKWICFSVYRPSSYDNLIIFFEELTKSVCKALNTYDNIIVMGDFNIDINKDDAIGYYKLDVFCDTLNLTNLVKSETCYTNNHKSTIDLFLTNEPGSFQFTSVTETGLSNYHRLITTFIKCHFSRLKPKLFIIVTLKDLTSKNLLLMSKMQIFLLKQTILMKITQL